MPSILPSVASLKFDINVPAKALRLYQDDKVCRVAVPQSPREQDKARTVSAVISRRSLEMQRNLLFGNFKRMKWTVLKDRIIILRFPGYCNSENAICQKNAQPWYMWLNGTQD